MPKHVHADLIMEYAKLAQVTDRPWEYFEVLHDDADGWSSFAGEFYFNVDRKYRLKPRTIKIGEIEFPEPIRYTLECGDTYFIPCLNWLGDLVREQKWINHSSDYRLLSAGLIHLSIKAAELHAKALISLTQK